MLTLQELQSLSESSKLASKAHPLKRQVTQGIADRSMGKEYIGLLGPRGAGKTVALQQIAQSQPDSFYLSVDTLPRDADLFKILKDINSNYRPALILLDEVHYNRNINQTLKNAHDFLECQIIFTSSIAVGMYESSLDLSRRIRLISMPYFSFLDYALLESGEPLKALSLEEILNERLANEYMKHDHLFKRYLQGHLCPFSRDVTSPKEAMRNILSRIIEQDIPQFGATTPDEVADIQRVMQFIGRSVGNDINPSSVSKKCGIPRSRAERFLSLLEKAFVIQRVWPKQSSNVLREPKVLIYPPFRLLYRDIEDAIGGLREDYCVWALTQRQLPFRYLKSNRGEKCPDFLIEQEGKPVVIEVGGKGKGRSQFKGLNADYKKFIFKDGPPYNQQKKPLWSLGCFYT